MIRAIFLIITIGCQYAASSDTLTRSVAVNMVGRSVLSGKDICGVMFSARKRNFTCSQEFSWLSALC
jgi:hypothetical protein